MNNIELFIGMTILGITIISTYFYYIGKSSTELVDKLWVGIDKKYRPRRAHFLKLRSQKLENPSHF